MSGPQFRKGGDAAAEATKGGGNFAKTHFFSLDDGKSAVLRFLTDADEWIVVDQHQVVPTKGKPEGYDGNWPEKMGAVCRRDPAFAGMFDDCYICDHVVDGKRVRKPGARSWALACLREEVVEDGKIVGYRDQTREVTRKVGDGDNAKEETSIEKAIVVVNMGFKNFFSILQGFAGHYGTVLDRDYVIKRSGSDQSTTYSIIPLDPIETAEGRFDLREPKFMERYATDIDLAEVVTERASDDFYARFFDPRFTQDKDGKVQSTGVTEVPKPDNDVDADRLAALASRVKGYGGEAGGDTPAEAAPAAAGGMRDFG